MNGLFKRSTGNTPPPVAAPASGPGETVLTSKVFPRFLSLLSQQPAPVLLDLGMVVGSNVGFFGDRLACKLYVEDLNAEVEAHARRGERDRLAAFLGTRLTQGEDSVDGILCWDIFDFLDRQAGKVLAARLVRLLKKGGALYGFFGTTPVDLTSYSRFAVENETRLRVRTTPASLFRRDVLLTRDIIKMFDGLAVSESVLLKSNTRETLFRR